MKTKEGCGCSIVSILTLLMVLIIIGAVVFDIAGHYNDTTYSVVVSDKERIDNRGSGYYLIFCQDTSTGDYYEFKCSDTLLRGKFDSSRFYNQIKEGNQYKFTVIGWRVPIFSMYPNIIKMEEI